MNKKFLDQLEGLLKIEFHNTIEVLNTFPDNKNPKYELGVKDGVHHFYDKVIDLINENKK